MSKRKTTEQFIQESKEVHDNKYSYELVDYVNNKTKVKIICPDHGVFEQMPVSHICQGHGCKKCADSSLSNHNRNKLLKTTDFITKAKEVHGDRYSYELVDYIDAKTKVKIICPEHGVFEQLPNSHIRNHGCSKCTMNNKPTTEQFITKAKEVHGDRYSYELVGYVNNNTKVRIICPEHGVFEQRPTHHIDKKHGCPRCNGGVIITEEEFIIRSWCVHGDKYNYKLVNYIGSQNKVKITCPEHGVFEMQPNNHIHGQNCPTCFHQQPKSKQEQELSSFVASIGIDITTNDRSLIAPLELDIVIPSKKIAIEYNGLYWHSEQQGKDRKYHSKKLNLCNEKGYQLITIFEDEWLLKKDIVKSRLKHILGDRNRVVYARKCYIKEVKPSVAREFINKYHIQGYTGCSVKLGLFYRSEDDFGFPFDEMIAVMTFAVPSISKGNKTKKGTFELSRFCSSCAVTGGASKLLKHFIRNYDVSGLFTYADLRWSNGNLYKAIGFINERLTPVNYYYVVDGKRKHRYNYRKNVLKDKLETFDPNLTEYQNMINNKIDRIWDCGNLRYDYPNLTE